MKKFVSYVENRQMVEVANTLTKFNLDPDAVCEQVGESVRFLAQRNALHPDALYTVLEFGSNFGNMAQNWQNPGAAQQQPTASPMDPVGKETWWNKVRTMGANVGGFVNNVVRSGMGQQPQQLGHSRIQSLGGAALKSLTNLRSNLMGDPTVANVLGSRPAGVSVQPTMSFSDVLGVVQKALQDSLGQHQQLVQNQRTAHWNQ